MREIKFLIAIIFMTSFFSRMLIGQTTLITTIAGNQAAGFGGDNIQATSSSLNNPNSVVVDKFGNVYIADMLNQRIRKVSTNGIITTFAGTGTYGNNFPDGSLATASNLNYPAGIAVDTLGNVYFTEGNRVRKVGLNGILTTVAGTGFYGYCGDNGPATNACLRQPYGLAIDIIGNLYIADINNSVIRKVDVNGIITTVAGNNVPSFSGDNGLAINASLNYPIAVAVDSAGNIYIADGLNYRIRMVNTSGIITTIVGNGTLGNTGNNGLAINAPINGPTGVAVDANHNIYVSVYGNVIRKIDSNGIITNFAGNGTSGFSGDGGIATNAAFNHNSEISVDRNNNLYIADTYNNSIRKVGYCLTPSAPDICLITVDSLDNNNEIYWDKTLYPVADSFIVHREVSTNIYKRIGAVSKNAFSMYTDTNRSIGPNNGNPNFTSYKYKLQIRDICGSYSPLSLWHQTIFVQDNLNGNFQWNPYAIESTVTPVANYNLKRLDVATGNQTLVGSTSSNTFTDPQYASYWPLNYKWLVDAVGFSCNASAKIANPNGTLVQKTKTKSNHANDKIIATKLEVITSNNAIKVYPNPVKDLLTVELGIVNENVSIELLDLLGQKLFVINTKENLNNICINNYASGIYFLNIKHNNKTIAFKKVVIE